MWNATLTDNLELSNAWFSTNDSDQWFNYSPVIINGTSFDVNFNETINKSNGNYVCGMFYMNDSAGNLGETNMSCFFVANTYPTAPANLSADDNKKVGENMTALCAGSTDADNDLLTYFYEFYNLNDSAAAQIYSANDTYTIQISDAHDQIRIRCKANDGLNDSGEIEKTISAANTAPVLDIISNITADETDTIDITVNASDADNDSLIYFVNNTKFNQTNNKFLWVTGYDDAGFYSIKITASDGYDNDSNILYLRISDISLSSESGASDTGSIYSSRGIFLAEKKEKPSAETETTANHSVKEDAKKEKGADYELIGNNSDNQLKEKTNKITGSAISIRDKPSRPIGLTITFGIVFFGLFFYNIFNRKGEN